MTRLLRLWSRPSQPFVRQIWPVVALTGCDGAGKSTLAAKLVAHLGEELPAEALYLGQSSGRIGEWIATVPLVGAPLKRFLTRKSDRIHEDPSVPPGSVAALAIYLLSRWRAHKFRRMLAMCRRGIVVVTDRYPQAQIAGFLFDGPQLAATIGGNAWVRALRSRERALYEWMAAAVPTLVIRLNVDAETAHARKPDHKPADLRRKIAAWPQLRFNGARMLDLDAREDAAVLLDVALREVRAALHAQGA